jgi:hypothetical protein
MSEELRLTDRFIPVMDAYLYWDWQRGYTCHGGKEYPVPEAHVPDTLWVRLGDIYGEVSFQDVGPGSNSGKQPRQPGKIVRFCVQHVSRDLCSDDPEVWALLEKLGITPKPAVTQTKNE